MDKDILRAIGLIPVTIFSGFFVTMIFVELNFFEFTPGIITLSILILAFIGEVYLAGIKKIYRPRKANVFWIICRVLIGVTPIIMLFISGIYPQS